MSQFIKICGDPHCDAIFHNCPDEAKKCLDCGGKLIKINEKTYQSKFALNFFQYDYTVGTGEYYRPNVSLINEGNINESVEATNLNLDGAHVEIKFNKYTSITIHE